MNTNRKGAASFAVLLVGLIGMQAPAQGFDEGSFGTGAGAGSAPATQPAASGSGGGGFGESSFGEGASAAPSGSTVLPPPSGTPDVGPGIAAPGSGGGSGFDDGSFVEGGGSAGGTTPGASAPAGGDDFPGGTTIPGGGGGVADVNPRPSEPATQPGGSGDQGPSANATPGPRVDPQITAVETRDFGVPPQTTLRQGQFHGPTPVAIPGANLVTTESLVQAMNGGMQIVLIDVLGSNYSIPGAFSAQALASPGNFQDRTQQQAGAWLGQITGSVPNTPIVIFCSDPMCWLSYNAALRTVAAGYTNVYWYRGGLQAWQMAGLPLHPAGF